MTSENSIATSWSKARRSPNELTPKQEAPDAIVRGRAEGTLGLELHVRAIAFLLDRHEWPHRDA
jgi:hypothetical protein